ncbi:MAG TPA: formyltransferase family protein [Flavobacterium sp.]|jgi:methionyl-tRNA formyltransferase
MKIQPNPAVVLVGSVNSSRKTLEKLIEHKINITGVLGLDPAASKNVSGYVDLKPIAQASNIPFRYFTKINSEEAEAFVKECNVDLLFIIGLSQMVHGPLLKIPRFGCVGFHPTRLPEGRGRGAVAWIILGLVKGAATLFHMDEGMDSGPILVQEPFEIGDDDYAQDVIDHIVESIGTGLDRVLPELKKGIFNTSIQDESKASYLAKRNPEDGLINWDWPAEEIHRLIRAVSRPLPGAYTYAGTTQLRIFKASLSNISNHLGIPGRVIISDDKHGIHVQTGHGLLKLEEFEGVEKEKLKVGYSLGLKLEKEFLALLRRVEELEQTMDNNNE